MALHRYARKMPVQTMHSSRAPISHVTASAYRIPTSQEESDGTLTWHQTTLVIARVQAGDEEGLGFTYAARAAVAIIEDTLSAAIAGRDALDIPGCWQAMRREVRNIGRLGLVSCAIAAVDNALWDVKAKLLGLPLAHLLGMARESAPVYGSGGFTNYSPGQIVEQIERWRESGIWRFKIKIGRDREEDHARVQGAVEALWDGDRLFVDANGAYYPKEALEMAAYLSSFPVAWFEEPVSSDDIAGLRLIREQGPAGICIAAGEYGYDLDDFRRLLAEGAVDVLQADATRCEGVTGFLKAAALCEAHHRPLSAHCAPALHTPLICHAVNGIHVEYFWDHARIETMLFEGIPPVRSGCITPNTNRPGFGFVFKDADARRYAL